MKTKSKINIIVCGGNGFIGTNILKELVEKKNFNIFATYNKKHKNIKKVKWIKTNLLNLLSISARLHHSQPANTMGNIIIKEKRTGGTAKRQKASKNARTSAVKARCFSVDILMAFIGTYLSWRWVTGSSAKAPLPTVVFLYSSI